MNLKHFEQGGVKSGPYGSLLRNEYGIADNSRRQVYAGEGLVAQADIMRRYQAAGATFGEAHTFGLGLRVDPLKGDQEWEYNKGSRLYLPSEESEYASSAVKLAREFNGTSRPWVATLAPLTDTSGGHDAYWEALGSHQFEWARQRHEPFLSTVRNAGAEILWAEAFRYQLEAEAVVSLARDLGYRMVVICFEAKSKGHPDPSLDSGYRFKESKQDLKNTAGSSVIVWVGENCTGVSVIQSTWARRDEVDVIYPNQKDFGNGNEKHRSRYLELIHAPQRSQEEESELAQLEDQLNSPVKVLQTTWQEAKDHGVKVIGICCGGTPGLVEHASHVFHGTKR